VMSKSACFASPAPERKGAPKSSRCSHISIFAKLYVFIESLDIRTPATRACGFIHSFKILGRISGVTHSTFCRQNLLHREHCDYSRRFRTNFRKIFDIIIQFTGRSLHSPSFLACGMLKSHTSEVLIFLSKATHGRIHSRR